MGIGNSDLRIVRKHRNISLKQVADDTHISLRHLKNLEEGRFDELPGGMYNRAFLRTYCDYLGLEPQQVLSQYDSEVVPPSFLPTPYQPQAVGHVNATTAPLKPAHFLTQMSPFIIWGIILLATSFGIYFSRDWVAHIFSPYFRPAVPFDFITESNGAEGTAALSFSALAESSMLAAPQAFAPHPEVLSLHQASPPRLRLDFEVQDKCWISVNRDGVPGLVKLLEPGDALSLNADERLYVILGNAGGVQVRINGVPTKPLGGVGDVVRMAVNEENWEDYLEGNGM